MAKNPNEEYIRREIAAAERCGESALANLVARYPGDMTRFYLMGVVRQAKREIKRLDQIEKG